MKKRLFYILLILHAIIFFWLIHLNQSNQPIGNRIFILPGLMIVTMFYALILFPLEGTPYHVTFDRNDPKFKPVVHKTLIHQQSDPIKTYESTLNWLKKIDARIDIDIPHERITAYRRDVGGEDSTPKDTAFHIEILFSHRNEKLLIEVAMLNPNTLLKREQLEPYWIEYIEEYAKNIGIDVTDDVLHSIYTDSIINEKIIIENRYIVYYLVFLAIGVMGYIQGNTGSILIIAMSAILIIFQLNKRNKYVKLKNRF